VVTQLRHHPLPWRKQILHPESETLIECPAKASRPLIILKNLNDCPPGQQSFVISLTNN
jgi:hypothetical protein